MSTKANGLQRWSTSSFGRPADTSPMELSALSEHMEQCKGSRGRMFRLRCAAETFHRLAAGRFLTILVLLLLLILLTSSAFAEHGISLDAVRPDRLVRCANTFQPGNMVLPQSWQKGPSNSDIELGCLPIC